MSAASLKKPKGHWPKGKPRGFVVPPTRLRQVRKWFQNQSVPPAGPGTQNDRSVKRVARAIGLSDRQLRRWLAGEQHPREDRWKALIAYLEELGF